MRTVVTAGTGGVCPDFEGEIATGRARSKESRTADGEKAANQTLLSPSA